MPDPSHVQTMLAAGLAAMARAYAPYSGYRVGAAALGEDGAVYAGCNVENAAYPVGTCAEAGAIAAMVAGGARRLEALLVVAGGEALVAPCGACRQRIREFAADAVPIYLATPDGVQREVTAASLLPFAFGPDTLAAAESRA